MIMSNTSLGRLSIIEEMILTRRDGECVKKWSLRAKATLQLNFISKGSKWESFIYCKSINAE